MGRLDRVVGDGPLFEVIGVFPGLAEGDAVVRLTSAEVTSKPQNSPIILATRCVETPSGEIPAALQYKTCPVKAVKESVL